MRVEVRARESDGYDLMKANTNAGYGYVFAWAGIIDAELNAEGDNIKSLQDYFFGKVKWLYGWLEDKDENVQNGAIDALTTLEQSDWDFASQIMEAELAVIGDLGIAIEGDYI